MPNSSELEQTVQRSLDLDGETVQEWKGSKTTVQVYGSSQ